MTCPFRNGETCLPSCALRIGSDCVFVTMAKQTGVVIKSIESIKNDLAELTAAAKESNS